MDVGYDLLIGGCLASSVENGRQIVEMAARNRRIVEAGFQRRYDPAWEEIRRLVAGGELGVPVMAVTTALWNPDPDGWYYDQEESGGMPLTHMSYCYLNAVRWILGQPTTVSAMANRLRNTAPGRVNRGDVRGLDRLCKRGLCFGHGQLYRPRGHDRPPAAICLRRGRDSAECRGRIR